MMRPTNLKVRTSTMKAHSRVGFSLLEVVLALTILAMATAYLAQAMNIATTNALRAERLTQAELVAESVMNQVIAGVIPSQPVTWTQYISAGQQGMGQQGTGMKQWMYQLQSVQTEMEGMIGIQIAVQEVSADGLMRSDYDFFVNRWIIDPALGLDTPPEETEEEAASGDASSSSSGSTGSAGADAGGAASAGAAALPPLGGFGGPGGFGGGGPGGGPGGQNGPGGGRGGAGGPGGGGRGGGQGGGPGGGGPGGGGARGGGGGGQGGGPGGGGARGGGRGGN